MSTAAWPASSCQFNSGELCPLERLDSYIQDALDLVEFANGATNTAWGAKRAALGHPKPFAMKMLGIGNEQWGQQYIERYAKFAVALKAKFPQIKLVSAAGPDPADERFRLAWSKLRGFNADIVDEHSYARPDWFFSNTHRYDNYDRNGPKVFMGEYAAQSDKVVSVKNRNDLECALAEAAFMTGLERNAEVVRMASYAPLFANTEAWQWTPNLIWADSLNLYGTPNYYAQQLFSRNRGDVVLPTQLEGIEKSASGMESLYASATRDDGSDEIILKVVNPGSAPLGAQIHLHGVAEVNSQAGQTVLTGGNMQAQNSLVSPREVAPAESTISIAGTNFTHHFLPRSMTVLRIKTK